MTYKHDGDKYEVTVGEPRKVYQRETGPRGSYIEDADWQPGCSSSAHPAAPKPNSLVPACGVLAADDSGRALLQRRRDTGQWAIPMGKQELGETPSQCAIRETLEETGVLTELTGILGVYSDPGHIVAYSDGEVRQEWELIFLGRPISGTPTVNDEASDVRWVAPGDLEALDIHPTQWRQLRDWLTRAWPHVD